MLYLNLKKLYPWAGCFKQEAEAMAVSYNKLFKLLIDFIPESPDNGTADNVE